MRFIAVTRAFHVERLFLQQFQSKSRNTCTNGFGASETAAGYWYLTDVKKRAAEEHKPDEDGPASSEGEDGDEEEQKAADALVTDSDPDSPRSDQEASQSQAVILPVLDTQPREAFVAWRR